MTDADCLLKHPLPNYFVVDSTQNRAQNYFIDSFLPLKPYKTVPQTPRDIKRVFPDSHL